MVSWRGPRTGPCSTCLPVLIRTPEPYRRDSVSLLAVYRLGRAAWLSQQDVFSFGLVLYLEGLSTDPPCILLVLLLLVL